MSRFNQFTEKVSATVKEGWHGPGRKDQIITPITLKDGSRQLDPRKKEGYEWWYFDAQLDSGQTLVLFFYASNPNPIPGVLGKTGVEFVILESDGTKRQEFVSFDPSHFEASAERPEVRIGKNYLKLISINEGLATYRVFVESNSVCFDLLFTGSVKGWKPGMGTSRFGRKGYFSWAVPFPRAIVSGAYSIANKRYDVKGVGYHDHNWLNFPLPSIVDFWVWGRVYSESLTVSFLVLQCNQKMKKHCVKVLMLAEGSSPSLSTGEFDVEFDQEYLSEGACNRSVPHQITLRVPGRLTLVINVEEVLEAVDMLETLPMLPKLFTKSVLGLKPMYHRFQSRFEISIITPVEIKSETGEALHEIVCLR